jgi:hypothetical protein
MPGVFFLFTQFVWQMILGVCAKINSDFVGSAEFIWQALV